MNKELLEKEYQSALADLESIASAKSMIEEQDKEVRARVLSLMAELGIDQEKAGVVEVQRVKAPGKTEVGMPNVEFARKYPHLCAPRIADVKKAAKQDPALRELLVENEGSGHILRVIYRPLDSDAA